ncbi:putative ACT domain-containing protein ACR1-12 [Helianthus anomalus]
MQVTDEESGLAIIDREKLSVVNKMLCNVLKGSNKGNKAKIVVSHGLTLSKRRLYQMMFTNGDYERPDEDTSLVGPNHPEKRNVLIHIKTSDVCKMQHINYIK